MKSPEWAFVKFEPIDYQAISYYSAPKRKEDGPKSLDEIDPQVLEAYKKLGIPLDEQERLAGIAVDAVFDSVSVATTFKGKLKDAGVIFCPISEAIREHPELIKQYLGSVVPPYRQFFCRIKFRRIYRWLLCLYSQRRALPDGIIDLFPHQRRQHRAV